MDAMMTKCLSVVAAMMVAGFALAGGDGIESPKAESYSPNWLGLLCLIVFLAATAVVGFKTAKRIRVD